VTGEPLDHAARLARYCERWNAGAWDELLAEQFAEDVVFRDHRPGAWPELRGHDAFLDVWRSAATMVPGARTVMEVLEADGDRCLATVRLCEGPGEPVREFDAWAVQRVAGGRVVAVDFYGNLADARAAFGATR
jgi:ketosteroid isomerase-like protein